MHRWGVCNIGTCRLRCIVRGKLSSQVGNRGCRRGGWSRKGFYGTNVSIFGLSCDSRVNGGGEGKECNYARQEVLCSP